MITAETYMQMSVKPRLMICWDDCAVSAEKFLEILHLYRRFEHVSKDRLAEGIEEGYPYEELFDFINKDFN